MTSALNSFKPGLEEKGPAHLFRFDAESAHPWTVLDGARGFILEINTAVFAASHFTDSSTGLLSTYKCTGTGK